MTKIEQLVKRYDFVRKMWVNSHTQAEEDEWYNKLIYLEGEIKKYRETLNKPRKGGSELGSEVLMKYIGLKEKGSQEG